MQASWLEMTERSPVSEDDLRAIGVIYRQLPTDPAAYEPILAACIQERGYQTQDVVELSPQVNNLAELCRKFRGEHLHQDDEVRFVLAGSGIFDVRSIDDQWIRLEVTAGDMMIVPKGLQHRFMLTSERFIRCARLFVDPAGWVPVYRQP